jgi:hypothetical protein
VLLVCIKLILGFSKVTKLVLKLSDGIQLILPSTSVSWPFMTCKKNSSHPILFCHVYPLHRIIAKSTNTAISLFHLILGYTSALPHHQKNKIKLHISFILNPYCCPALLEEDEGHCTNDRQKNKKSTHKASNSCLCFISW